MGQHPYKCCSPPKIWLVALLARQWSAHKWSLLCLSRSTAYWSVGSRTALFLLWFLTSLDSRGAGDQSHGVSQVNSSGSKDLVQRWTGDKNSTTVLLCAIGVDFSWRDAVRFSLFLVVPCSTNMATLGEWWMDALRACSICGPASEQLSWFECSLLSPHSFSALLFQGVCTVETMSAPQSEGVQLDRKVGLR